MVDEGGTLRLGDVVTLQRGTTYKSALLNRPGPVLLGLASIRPNGGFRDDNLKTYGGESPDKLTLYPGDIYVSLKDVTQSADLLGAIARVPAHVRSGRVTQDTVKLRFVRDDVPSRYLYWLLRTPHYRSYCRSHAIGTTNLSLAREDFLAFPVPRPRSREMTLVETLDALDDKIEVIRRINATLEAMARTLFRSWFVDFDPVRAKLEGRQPAGMDAQTVALFPSKFQDSPLGPIPFGWEVDTIKNRALNLQYGFTQSASDVPIGPRFLRITDIRGGRIDWASVPFCLATSEECEKYRVMDGDIFIARTGASTGESIYVIEPPPAVFASYLIRVQFDSPSIARMVGEFVRTADYANHVAGTIGGSAQPNASAQTLAAASLVYPDEQIAQVFYQTLRPFDEMRAANDRVTCTLAELRETLLAKLLCDGLMATTE